MPTELGVHENPRKAKQPVDVTVQINLRVPWFYREQLIEAAHREGISVNRLLTNALVTVHPPMRPNVK